MNYKEYTSKIKNILKITENMNIPKFNGEYNYKEVKEYIKQNSFEFGSKLKKIFQTVKYTDKYYLINLENTIKGIIFLSKFSLLKEYRLDIDFDEKSIIYITLKNKNEYLFFKYDFIKLKYIFDKKCFLVCSSNKLVLYFKLKLIEILCLKNKTVNEIVNVKKPICFMLNNNYAIASNDTLFIEKNSTIKMYKIKNIQNYVKEGTNYSFFNIYKDLHEIELEHTPEQYKVILINFKTKKILKKITYYYKIIKHKGILCVYNDNDNHLYELETNNKIDNLKYYIIKGNLKQLNATKNQIKKIERIKNKITIVDEFAYVIINNDIYTLTIEQLKDINSLYKTISYTNIKKHIFQNLKKYKKINDVNNMMCGL